jgi:MYXO-CTERM domain-containing protein
MRVLVAAITSLSLFSTVAASAADEVTTLETQLKKETTELSTSDCAAACKALASIRRAADRICSLEPGPRCEAAHAKAEDATKRVRDACPECAIAQVPSYEEDKKAATPAPAPAEPPMAKNEAAEAPRGGCRNCATSSGTPDRGDFAVFALAALLVRRKVRKRV